MNNFIFAYYQQIESGEVNVGRWVRAWYKHIISGIETQAFFYDAKKANAAVRFIETFCHHHEGAKAPGVIQLELWQKALVSVLFGIIDETGARQFREALVIMGRKNGKTLLAAAIAEYMLFLDDYGARVYFCAPKLQQANLCYDALYQMITKEPELAAMTNKRRTDLYIGDNNASAMPLAFSAKKSDGLNPTLAVCDEIAAWRGDAGLKQYEVLKSAQGARRQPMLLCITTAGYENDSIYDELMKRSTRLLLGDSKETRLAPFLYTIDDPEKWNDINELRKSNPNLGVSVSVDYLLEEIAVAEGSLSKKAEFLTKYCNLKQSSSLAWLSSATVDKMMGAPLKPEDFRDCYCVGGIDLSQTTDLTAACVVIEKAGRLHVLAKSWLPAEKVDEATARDGVPYNAMIQRGLMATSGDNFVDYKDVFQWFVSLVETYHIYPLKVGYDRYSSQYLVQDMKAYGFHMDDVFQGENLYPVLMEFEGLAKDGKIDAGENDLLKMHALNGAIKMSNERGRGKLVKLSPTAHIDIMAALIDAMTVRQKYYSEISGQLENRHRSEDSGTL